MAASTPANTGPTIVAGGTGSPSSLSSPRNLTVSEAPRGSIPSVRLRVVERRIKASADMSIVYTRDTGDLVTNRISDAFRIRVLRWISRALQPLSHIGISRVFGLVNGALKPTGNTLVIGANFRFAFPSGDYYWDRLLVPSYEYEPELEFLLERVSSIPFCFIDLGANFGFWSSRVAQGEFGVHPVIAVEPSSVCQAVLRQNLSREEYHNASVAIKQLLVAELSGETRNLYGKRHAGLSIDSAWDLSSAISESVETVSIDDLYFESAGASDDQPVIVKMDIEGSELFALHGGKTAAAKNTLFIIEDAEQGGISSAVIFANVELGMTLFLLEANRMTPVESWKDLIALKSPTGGLKTIVLNIAATSSAFWLDCLSRDCPPFLAESSGS